MKLCIATCITSLLAALPSPAGACATAPPVGVQVNISGEEAVIVWDPATRTEHFVRRASFHGAPRDFGFLVPTPSQPSLAEAKEELFERLAQETRPPEVYTHPFGGFELGSLCLMTFFLRASRSAAVGEGVRVLDRARVGGYDAVVLEARDPASLAAWLTRHGYDNRPSLRAWLAPYVEAGWKITAFKIAADGGPATTSPVRLTFQTERPLFPYREPPADEGQAQPAGRLLRVYFFADRRHDGQIGDGARPWPGQTELARPLDAGWLGSLPGGHDLGSPRYLTLFEDRSSPRPGFNDLFFLPSTAGDRPRDPIVHSSPWKIPIPVELLGIGLVGALWIRRRRQTGDGPARPR